jgi:hypothetical protein
MLKDAWVYGLDMNDNLSRMLAHCVMSFVFDKPCLHAYKSPFVSITVQNWGNHIHNLLSRKCGAVSELYADFYLTILVRVLVILVIIYVVM